MNKGYLSAYFDAVGVKRLSAVDANSRRSNQHEVGTNQAMRRFLGTEKSNFEVTFIWFGEEQESITDLGQATHYDSRANNPDRSAEYRFYYPSNAVTEVMNEDDTLFLAKRHDGSLLFIVVAAESTMHGHLMWLFGLDHQPDLTFTVQDFTNGDDAAIDFLSRHILDEIGIEFEDPKANELDTIIERFGHAFPKTAEFSLLARRTLPEVRAEDDPDAALMAWLDHEEALFRRLERKIVSEQIAGGFADGDGVDVDAFIRYSLSVHNRRKSRMGHSFEHQLKAVFDALELNYDTQVITENNNKPDFIFPGENAYRDEKFPTPLLTMLAAKSTCKDRWRQVLPEAMRIPEKHLVTLEPGISTAQTDAMAEAAIRLVVPSHVARSYTAAQQEWLLSVKDFTNILADRQGRMG